MNQCRDRGIIGDRQPLHDVYTPETIRHRDSELAFLSSLLSPVDAGGIAKTALIYGPPGTGKTLTTTTVLERVENEHSVPTVTADCWTDNSRSRVLYSILSGLVDETIASRETTPADDLLYRIRETITEPTIIFLDEADKLTDDLVLRDLYEIPDVRLLMAANARHQVVGSVEHRVYSRIGTAQDVKFEKYHDDELVAILEDRLTAARVKPDVVSSDALASIADAGERDARKAIATLRNALDLVVAREHDRVTDEIIDEAAVKASEDIARARISSLTAEQRVVLGVLADIGPASSSDIYAEFAERVDEPPVDRTVRKWLGEKFPQYNLVREIDSAYPTEYELTDAARVSLERERED